MRAARPKNRQERKDITPWAIASARVWQDMTQEELAALLSKELGTPWTSKMVSHLENGQKVPTIKIVGALMKIQNRSFSWYLLGPEVDRESVGPRGIEPRSTDYKSAPEPKLLPAKAA